MFTFDDTYSAFDASMEAPASPEPPLPLVFAAGFRLVTGFGQDDSLHAYFGRKGFIIAGVNTPVGAGLPWWLTKLLNMSFKQRLPLGFVSRVASQHLVLSDEARMVQ